MFGRKKKPTERIKRDLNELLQYNDHTRDAEVAEMYLGEDIFVARLRRPRVIEGQWEDVDRTVDIRDLIDAHQDEQRISRKEQKK